MKALYDLPAPAKLNLWLHVTGKRADGYHDIESLFVPIDWQDTLHIERRADAQLHRHDLAPQAEALPADDLCLRAARALQAATGCTLGADIHLHKSVPSGAGLGGGSSDAATVLLALNRLWRLHLSRPQLLALALPLGADVPFFVHGTCAVARGVGEELTAVEVPPRCYVVVKPPVHIATKSIFESPHLQRSPPSDIVAGFPSGVARNDLQDAAQAVCPQVAQALDLLSQAFGNSRMTGSGSAVFADLGLTSPGENGSTAPCQATALPALPAGWTGRVCRSLSAHPLREWATD